MSDKATLKAFFETGDVPTQAEYADLIDSSFNTTDEPGNTPNTWGVNTNGSDSNVGSPEFPFETIQAAHDAAAADDTIIIQDIFFGQGSGDTTTITKDITIKGIAPNYSGETRLKGTWVIDAFKIVRFENISLFNVTFSTVNNCFVYLTNCSTTSLKTGAGRHILLRAQSCQSIDLSTPANYSNIIDTHNCRFTGAVNLGGALELHESVITGNVTSGIDGGSSVNLYNSTLDGNLTSTGNMTKYNSVITGTETVSGTTTNEVQDDVTKLSKTAAAAQVVVSNVEFQNGVLLNGGTGDPTKGVSWGDGDTTAFELVDDVLDWQFAGTTAWRWSSASFGSNAAGQPTMRRLTPSATAPGYSFLSDTGTGTGKAAAGQPNTVASGVEAIRSTNASGIIVNLFTDSYGSKEKSADPIDPPEGQHQIWQSDGTGSGDDGDIMMKITAGGVTKTTTLVDFSTI